MKTTGVNRERQSSDPIELFIVAVLILFEGICWVINELAGYHRNHQHKQQPEVATTATIEPTLIARPHVQPLHSLMDGMTVKELRKITGITSRKYRKADLIHLAMA